MSKILTFEFEKETPHTFRYKEIVSENEEISIPSIYIRKIFFEGKRPDKFQLVLKFEEPKE